MQQDVYVSTTGLQVRNAPGDISADARTLKGVHHTLSVWTDRQAMRACPTTGPHLEAMRPSPISAAFDERFIFCLTDITHLLVVLIRLRRNVTCQSKRF
jgi:hypothetical protein